MQVRDPPQLQNQNLVSESFHKKGLKTKQFKKVFYFIIAINMGKHETVPG